MNYFTPIKLMSKKVDARRSRHSKNFKRLTYDDPANGHAFNPPPRIWM